MHYFTARLTWFKAQSLARQLILCISLTLLMTLIVYFISLASSPTFDLLFNHLDSKDISQIIKQLEASQINYQVNAEGTAIFIEKNLINKTRIQLMSSTLQLSSSVGFELFDKNDFGMTDFSQKINYQRALQGELERTIRSLKEINSVRVHLVIPHENLFQNEVINQPRAAVSLQLKKKLTPKQVKGIQQLISASVAQMPINNVIIVDENGNNLSLDPEDEIVTTQLLIKKTVENYLNNKILTMLHKIFSDEDVMVKIDATLNYDKFQSIKLSPGTHTLTYEKETQHLSNKTLLEKPQTQDPTYPSNQELMHEKNYQYGSSKENFSKAKGKIERLTVSVIVPKFTDTNTLHQLESMVKSIIGFNNSRGDSLSIQALLTKHKELKGVKQPLIIQQESQILTNSYLRYVLFSLVAICITSCFFFIKQNKKRRAALLTELSLWLEQYE